MIICEYAFNDPDPENPDYSLHEVDFYAHVPLRYDYIRGEETPPRVRNHRLSLRKNLKTGEFELYRKYYDDDSEEVIFRGSLEKALAVGNIETRRFWEISKREGFTKSLGEDRVCQHKEPVIDRFFCPYAKQVRGRK